jgi:uncharacterized protein
MTGEPFYHRGSRELQDHFDSRRLADRLAETRVRRAFSDDDRAFIGRCRMFFLATADADGAPDCSYKGGDPGFVRVTGPAELAFPDYDGNGMFRSLGNIAVNPQVGLLFVDFERPGRLRVNGRASVSEGDPLIGEFAGAQLIVRVQAERIFPNCPRYIHQYRLEEPSKYVPRGDTPPPRPGWKDMDDLKNVLPARDRTDPSTSA